MSGAGAGTRLGLLVWSVAWTWAMFAQVRRQSWGWAVGNSLLAAVGLWAYVELIIDDTKRDRTTNDAKAHLFDPIHNGADECECGLIKSAPVHNVTG